MKESFSLKLFSKEFILSHTSLREGEIKIGQQVKTSFDDYSSCKFMILGISEDFGPQANGGRLGSKNGFSPFISSFLSIQANQFLQGDNILLLGEISSNYDFLEVNKHEIINELDDFVCNVLSKYLQGNQSDNYVIPIIIGGGHNNAYPLIKSVSSLIYKQKINVINFDAHADFRKTDFRHSGNPFSWAFYENYIQQYAVLGLHESYNNQYMIDELIKNNCLFSWFDDYIYDNDLFERDLNLFKNKISETKFGIELDLDAIAFMPSSALSPSGFSVEQARKYISVLSREKNATYLHLCEGAPQDKVEQRVVGKVLAYFVSDFMKGVFSVLKS